MTIKVDLTEAGVAVSIGQPLGKWARNVNESLLALASELMEAAQQERIGLDSSSFVLPNQRVAGWAEDIARQAQLPPRFPCPLDLRLTAGLGQPGTQINVRWLRPGTSLPVTNAPIRIGLEMSLNREKFRISEPIWSVLELVEQFNAKTTSPESQFETWSRIRLRLGDDGASKLTDSFLRSMRVIVADAFTLAISIDRAGDLQLRPRLLRRQPGSGETPGFSVKAGELGGVAVLVPGQEDLFVQRLDDLSADRNVFPLNDGTFVFVSPQLSRELAAVRRLRQGSPEMRRNAALNPSAILKELLNQENAQEQPLTFIETDSYSDRVTRLAAWAPQIVPWIKIIPMSWGKSAQGGFRIGDAEVNLGLPEVVTDRHIRATA